MGLVIEKSRVLKSTELTASCLDLLPYSVWLIYLHQVNYDYISQRQISTYVQSIQLPNPNSYSLQFSHKYVSLAASLRKLQTFYINVFYIDVLYMHWWDFTNSIPELMQSLNTAVQQAQVLYLGVSDTPA